MKGIRISMMYQYFDAQDRKIQAEIDFYENKISGNLSYDDLHRLEYLRIQQEKNKDP